MKNVYDIKREKKYNFALSTTHSNNKKIISQSVLVVVHLYYKEKINEYIQYIDAIPKEFDILFTVSDDEMETAIKKIYVAGRENVKVIKKENRGRDISALLVAAKEYILEYDYVCFVHDKNARNSKLFEDSEIWTRGLWENTLCSTEYIYNIVEVLQKHKAIGLLVPPTRISVDAGVVGWARNFQNTLQLKGMLQLVCDLNEKKPPITIGTFFWAKVEAIKKLLEYPWSYEDFDEEPLAMDGTISHAIERSLAYVAQDAGYETGWIMTSDYASGGYEEALEDLREVFDFLYKEIGLWTLPQIQNYQSTIETLGKFCNKFHKIYIYGAGKYGKQGIFMLHKIGRKADAVIVSDKEKNPIEYYNVPVASIEEISLNDEDGVIVATDIVYAQDIVNNIHKKKNGFDNFMFLDV